MKKKLNMKKIKNMVISICLVSVILLAYISTRICRYFKGKYYRR